MMAASENSTPVQSGQKQEREATLEGDPKWNFTEGNKPGTHTMLGKAQEFFQICDIENKGFITRRDMQRLHGELSLSLDELEKVFDTLDADGNSYLTLEEFSTGFNEVPTNEAFGEHAEQLQFEKVYQTKWEESVQKVEEDENLKFYNLIDSLGANKFLEDENHIKKLWMQLRKDEPHLLSSFEEFLVRIFSQLQEANDEKNEMECALKKKIATYDVEIQNLYEEMEQQIKTEKEQFLLQVSAALMFVCHRMAMTFFQSSEEEDVVQPKLNSAGLNGSFSSTAESENSLDGGHSKYQQLQRIISIEEDHLPQLLDSQQERPLHNWTEVDEKGQNTPEVSENNRKEEQIPRDEVPSSPRGQPVGKETLPREERVYYPPDRLFKIVVIGNSSVGKTSFLRRFCEDNFSPETSATVGIDYSVKTVTVDNCQVALQLWDTAGQERYRSITKQFFRKADGVIVMYDITCKETFTSVRQWLTSVEEAAGENIPILMLGNKTDNEREREVPCGVGEHLAKDCNLMFYECSASTGHNAKESVLHLARVLKEQEDKVKEKTVHLLDSPKKMFCCSRQ
ncbi:hypothetical protein FKM82_011757 [Ascaphus truei]